MRFFVFVLCLLSTSAGAETRIYQTNAYGNKRYDLPSKVVKGNQIYEADPYGNVRHDLSRQVIQGNKIYTTDGYGKIRYDLPSQVVVQKLPVFTIDDNTTKEELFEILQLSEMLRSGKSYELPPYNPRGVK